MLRLKQIALAALIALALAAGAFASTTTQQHAGDPSQWGVAKKGSFELTGLTGDPSQWG
jgi:uncharacterized membrane protein